MSASEDPRRRVPAVEGLLQQAGMLALAARHGRGPLLRELRSLLDELRALAGREPAALEARLPDLEQELGRRLEAAARPSLRRVVNATGVVVHTNLGRAPLPAAAAARVAEVAAGYSNLELDLASGGRGQREGHIEGCLQRLLGAAGSVVVNNCAAALLLAVDTLAAGREVLVSRGELVEIGGSFRIPDVLRKGGARLVEVGTTNRTRLADYRAALSPATGLILKVHPSNFRIVGFSESPSLPELVGLAREAGLPLVEDLGSGYLGGLPGLEDEPSLRDSLAAGVDLVAVSGDKLLGGPQAGLLVGHAELCAALRRNPLYRALRVDKLTLAALAAVLAEHAAGRAAASVPVARMLSLPAAAVEARASALRRRLAADCPALETGLRPDSSAVGGGAAPTLEVPTVLLTVARPGWSAERLAARLRSAATPVVGRVLDDRLALDLRTVAEDEEPLLLAALREAAGEAAPA